MWSTTHVTECSWPKAGGYTCCRLKTNLIFEMSAAPQHCRLRQPRRVFCLALSTTYTVGSSPYMVMFIGPQCISNRYTTQQIYHSVYLMDLHCCLIKFSLFFFWFYSLKTYFCTNYMIVLCTAFVPGHQQNSDCSVDFPRPIPFYFLTSLTFQVSRKTLFLLNQFVAKFILFV